MFLRARTVLAVFRSAFGNSLLLRVGAAYALFSTAEYAIWISLLVFAYHHGGATAATIIVLVQLIPCIALGPFLGAVADRLRPSRVLVVGYGLQAFTMAAVALSIGTHAPTAVVFVLSPLTALSLTITRPPQAALLPAIVRTPDELTAANVMSGWTDGAAALVGPATAGILLAWQGAASAIAAAAMMSAVSTVLVASVAGPQAAVWSDEAAVEIIPGEQDAELEVGLISTVARSLASIVSGARTNLLLAVGNRQIRVLLTLHAFYFMLIGALDLLCVVIALNFLHMGAGGPGFLNASLGGGALVAGFVTAFLVGRRYLANTLTVAISVAVAALAAIDVVREVAPVILLIATVGLAGAVFDITGRTLLQRSAPSDAIAGSFSILEALMDTGIALGAVLVRATLAIGGLRAALIAPAAIALALIGAMWRQLRNIDASATVPQVEIQLLRSISIFAALPAPVLEGVARELEPMTVSQGTVVINEGDAGDYYYAVADGELTISRRGQLVQTVARGDGFGEIALIREVPRQASVMAVTDVSLYALRKELFVQTVTGHVRAAKATRTIIAGHLGPGNDRSEPSTSDDSEGPVD